MKLRNIAALTLAAAATAAQAQESNLNIVIGAKFWYADWTTWFTADTPNDPPAGAPATYSREIVQQVAAKSKLISIPQISIRYGDFIGSVSAALKSTQEFSEPGLSYRFEREEIDANLGYYLTPGLAATVGFKKFSQSVPGGATFYEVSGPTFGLSGSAQLSGGFSMYGALGLGRLTLKGVQDAKSTYSLSEVGLAYTIPTGRLLKAISLTAGYRNQVLVAKDLSLTDTQNNTVKQDARDVTQGLTFGLVAVF
jgi:hypothetical protein